MARARNIKPAFFKNEELAELPFEYRLLFIGLWTMADREGRLEDRPKRIRMEVFPADDVDCDQGVQALHEAGFVVRYVIDGLALIEIPKFAEHQSPHHKEHASTLPPRVSGPSMKVEPEAEPVKHEAKAPGKPGAEVPCEGGSTALIVESGYLNPESRKKQRAKPKPAIVVPDWLDPLLWQRWHDFRQRKSGKGWTDDAQRLSIATLTKLRAAGHDPQGVIERSIELSYTGLFELPAKGINGQPVRDAWWTSDAGMKRKCAELGIAGPRPGESPDQVKGRINEAMSRAA